MKNIFAFLLIIFIPIMSFAQGGRNQPDNGAILEKRATYIALRLDLSIEQAVFFKGKYIEYEDRRKTIRGNYHQLKRKPTTDAAAEQQIEARFQMEEDLLAAKRLFYQQIKGEISSLKIMLLPKAETEFKELLIQRLQQNKRGRG